MSKRKIVFFQRLFSILTSFSLVFQPWLLISPSFVWAQEEPTPTPTPTVTVTVVPEPTESTPTPEITVAPTIVPTVSPAPTPEITVTPTVTSTISPTPTPTEMAQPDLAESPAGGQSATLNPSLGTDKDDYPPTGTVILTGKDFPANTELTIRVTWPDGKIRNSAGTEGETDKVITDASGNLLFPYSLRGEGQNGEYLAEVLNGETVLATVKFTDVNQLLLKINEFSSDTNPEWVEIYNPSSSAVSLNGWSLLFDDQSSTSQKITFTNSDVIAAGDFKIVEHSYDDKDKKDNWLKNQGDTIILKNGESEIDRVESGKNKDVSNPDEDHSAGRCPDGGGEWKIMSPTKGSANNCSETSACQGLTGAIWTTNYECKKVNDNQFSTKDAVYLNGGPNGDGQGLSDGNYYVRVTKTDGTVLGNSGTSTVTVTGGVITTCVNLFNLTYFADSANGEYKVWVSKDNTFPSSCSKTDNFKIVKTEVSPTLTPTVTISPPVCGNGKVDSGEECDGSAPNHYRCTDQCKLEYLPYCGDNHKDEGEQCDGTDLGGANSESNFCTPTCKLVPVYDGGHECPKNTTPIAVKGLQNILISSKDVDGETLNLQKGQTYLFKVTGQYQYSGENGWKADAGYATQDNWLSRSDAWGITGANKGVTSLLSDMGTGKIGVVDWGEYSDIHEYSKLYTSINDKITFLISDWYDNWYGSSWDNQTGMGDNNGGLTLNVYECVSYGSISGMKFEDMNGNGRKDTGEKGLAGWTITLTGEGVGLTAMTESNGAYVFNNLISGSYQVCEVSQSGWKNTTGDKCQEVTVTAGTETKDVNFGNFQLGKVQGYKFYDKDDDGVWDADEKGIENWQICLTKGEDKKCQLTNETGYYKFENLAAGDYVLSEENRDGWRQSFPEKGTYTVSINSGTGIGESAPAYNFGNAPPAGLILSKTNSNLTAHPGDLVTYTLTIQVGQRTLSEMHLMDVLPEGFLYQTGTAKVDDQSLEPVITGNGKILTWNWTKPVEGESTVVVNYEVKIADSNQPSAYNNLAYVWGKGSPEVVSNIADSEVKIEPVVSHSEKVGGVGQVLGASTELPATGSNTELLIAALTLLLSGIILRFKIKKESLK